MNNENYPKEYEKDNSIELCLLIAPNYRNKGILIEEVIYNTAIENILNTEIELKENLQVELNNQLSFETLVSDIETKDGFNFGQVAFKNEDDVDSVIDFTIAHKKGKIESYES